MKTYGVWNRIMDQFEAEGLIFEEAEREIDGMVENHPDVERKDLEIREEEE